MRNDINKVEKLATIDVIKKRELLKPILNKENTAHHTKQRVKREQAFERLSYSQKWLR